MNDELTYKNLDQIPLLTKDQEIALSDIVLGVDSSEQDKIDAVGQLASHNIRLVIEEARRFQSFCGIEKSELVGEGTRGLTEAAWIFDPKKFNARFATHAMYWIRKRMYGLFYSGNSVRVPVNIAEKAVKYKRMSESNGASVLFSDDDWIEKLDCSPNDLKKIRASQFKLISLNKSLDEDGDESFANFIPDSNATNPAIESMKSDDYTEVLGALEELSEMEREIVVAQCMDDEKTKLEDLGIKFGVTGERVRQIKVKALKDLKKKLAKRGNLW
tara:strand:- start:6841 stop:7659 length:819 start_codon:yes stop_codon:yes gene_type:complete